VAAWGDTFYLRTSWRSTRLIGRERQGLHKWRLFHLRQRRSIKQERVQPLRLRAKKIPGEVSIRVLSNTLHARGRSLPKMR
jgi:hypothetical protein